MCSLGEALFLNSGFEDATIAVFRGAIDLFHHQHEDEVELVIPDYLMESYVRLGDYAYEKGKWDEAVKLYTEVLSKGPEYSQYPWALYRIAMSYHYLGKDDQSKEYLGKLRDQKNMESWQQVAETALKAH